MTPLQKVAQKLTGKKKEIVLQAIKQGGMSLPLGKSVEDSFTKIGVDQYFWFNILSNSTKVIKFR